MGEIGPRRVHSRAFNLFIAQPGDIGVSQAEWLFSLDLMLLGIRAALLEIVEFGRIYIVYGCGPR